ncbi:MAG: transposase [Candidatus Latescibacterota bacterium]
MTTRHHPFHLYLDDTVYFLTARVHSGFPVFNSDEKKGMLLSWIKKVFSDVGFALYAWVILNNHYHLAFKTSRGRDFPRAFQVIHGRCSYEVNKLDDCRGRKIFQNFWDRCIRDQRDFYVHLNYVHHNPVKHGYVTRMDEYAFSSYKYWCDKRSEEWVRGCLEAFPIVDFSLEQDDETPKANSKSG